MQKATRIGMRSVFACGKPKEKLGIGKRNSKENLQYKPFMPQFLAEDNIVGIHSLRGRPTLRTYRSVAGRVVPGINETRCSWESVGDWQTFSKYARCLENNFSETGLHPACLKTSAFETRDWKAAGILSI